MTDRIMRLTFAELSPLSDDEIRRAVVKMRPRFLAAIGQHVIYVGGRLCMGAGDALADEVIKHIRNERPVPIKQGGMG